MEVEDWEIGGEAQLFKMLGQTRSKLKFQFSSVEALGEEEVEEDGGSVWGVWGGGGGL